MIKVLTKIERYLTTTGKLLIKDVPAELTVKEFNAIPEKIKQLLIDEVVVTENENKEEN